MPRIIERAPAKINLTLRVAGRRSDGMHELQSLIAFALDVADLVTLEPGARTETVITGPFGGTIAGQNLIDLALAKVGAAAPLVRLGGVTLEKNVPVAAGIGGGSADAGALLRALRAANAVEGRLVDWQSLAADLGADVPVCLLNSPAWVTGVGERLEPIDALPNIEAVLVNPLRPMPDDKTAQVFKALGAKPLDPKYVSPAPPDLSSREALLRFVRQTGNDLEAAAERIAPGVADVKRALGEMPGCLHAAVSGGGPTCFGIFDNAAEAARRLAADHPAWWVRATRIG